MEVRLNGGIGGIGEADNVLETSVLVPVSDRAVEFGDGKGMTGGSVTVLVASGSGILVVVVVVVDPICVEFDRGEEAKLLDDTPAVAVMFSVEVIGEFAILPVRGVAEVFQVEVGDGGKTLVVAKRDVDDSVILTVGTNEKVIVFVLVERNVVVFVTTEVLTFGGKVDVDVKVLCRVKLEETLPLSLPVLAAEGAAEEEFVKMNLVDVLVVVLIDVVALILVSVLDDIEVTTTVDILDVEFRYPGVLEVLECLDVDFGWWCVVLWDAILVS